MICDVICVYLRHLRATCDGAMKSVTFCVIRGLKRWRDVICVNLRDLRDLRATSLRWMARSESMPICVIRGLPR